MAGFRFPATSVRSQSVSRPQLYVVQLQTNDTKVWKASTRIPTTIGCATMRTAAILIAAVSAMMKAVRLTVQPGRYLRNIFLSYTETQRQRLLPSRSRLTVNHNFLCKQVSTNVGIKGLKIYMR